MIIPIVRETLDHFNKCIPGLQRELDRSDLKECWDIQSVYDHLVNYQVFGLYQEESGLAGIFCIQEAPKLRILNLFWLGKDPSNKTPCDYQELDRFLTHMAKELGCKRIICDGRKGWTKIVGNLGYEDSARVYMKKI